MLLFDYFAIITLHYLSIYSLVNQVFGQHFFFLVILYSLSCLAKAPDNQYVAGLLSAGMW